MSDSALIHPTSPVPLKVAPSSPEGWHRRLQALADPSLRWAGMLWLGVAVIGQLLLAVYVVGFYGLSAAQGRLQDWSKVLPHGHVPGETFLNAVLASHLAFVVVIILGGALQLLPVIRRVAPGFHRWSGRLYLLSAVILSVGGLVMVWTRGTVGNLPQHLGVSLNAVFILVFSAIAWRHARARRVQAHRRWALRLFLAVSGVWFFRIGLMLWIVVNQGPAGFDPKTFTGPFLSFLSFAQFLLPLAVLELYFRTQDHAGPRGKWLMSSSLAVLTLATIGGIFAASLLMWLPRL